MRQLKRNRKAGVLYPFIHLPQHLFLVKRTLEIRARIALNAAAFLSQPQLECIATKDICRSRRTPKWDFWEVRMEAFALAVHYSVYGRIIAVSHSEVSRGVGYAARADS